MNATSSSIDIHEELSLAAASRTALPDTVEIDEVTELDGGMHATGHYIETSLNVFLHWGAHGWEIGSATVDGGPLDLIDEDEPHDNSRCDARMEDDEECDPDGHRVAVDQVFGIHRIPTAVELLALIGAAVIDAGHAGLDQANAEVLELFTLARQTPHHELGTSVLRTAFQRQFADAPEARSLSVAEDGTHVMRMSAGARAVIAALIDPSSAVNRAGVVYDDAIRDELAALFPIGDFWQRINDPAVSDCRYDPDAE